MHFYKVIVIIAKVIAALMINPDQYTGCEIKMTGRTKCSLRTQMDETSQKTDCVHATKKTKT